MPEIKNDAKWSQEGGKQKNRSEKYPPEQSETDEKDEAKTHIPYTLDLELEKHADRMMRGKDEKPETATADKGGSHKETTDYPNNNKNLPLLD